MPVVSVTPTAGGVPETVQIPDGLQESTDPTRTARIREQLVDDLEQRWEEAIAAIIATLRDSGVLDETASTYTRLRALRELAREEINEHVLDPTSIAAVRRGQHWTAPYLADAFERGRARIEELLLGVGYNEATVRKALTETPDRRRIEREQRVELYQSLLEIRQETVMAIVEQTRRVIEDGEDGEAQPANVTVPATVPETIQEAARNRSENVGQTRSNTAALTVIVALINRYALYRYRRAGVELVGAAPEQSTPAQRARNARREQHVRRTGDGDVQLSEGAQGVTRAVPGAGEVESPNPGRTPPDEPVRFGVWKTAKDDKVCELCRPLHGHVYRLDAVADGRAPRPPLHPNCRCLIIPLRQV